MKTLKIRNISDLHLEFFYNLYTKDANEKAVVDHLQKILPELDEDIETVLVVGGDLITSKTVNRAVNFFSRVIPRFKHVIYVLGNHEHYYSDLDHTEKLITDELSKHVDMQKITIAGNVPVIKQIGDVTFIACTLWTNYDNRNQACISAAQNYMNDFNVITKNLTNATPNDLLDIFENSVNLMENMLAHKDNSKTVICTHHMPSFKCVNAKYCTHPRAHLTNSSFASDLDTFITTYSPALWFFGHTHCRFHGKIGNTELICNPLGYPSEQNLLIGEYNPAQMSIL